MSPRSGDSENEAISPTTRSRAVGPPRESLVELGLIVLAVAVWVPATWSVGFLSDDFDLLWHARSIGIFAPFDHHFAPAVGVLFRALAEGLTSPNGVHALVVLLHGLNTIEIHRLTARLQPADSGRWIPIAAALIFGIAPGGHEALFWLAAGVYVPLAWFFLRVIRLLVETGLPVRVSGPARAYAVAAFQGLAWLFYDWALVIAPIAFSMLVIGEWEARRRSASVRSWSEILVLWGPLAIAWATGVGLRAVLVHDVLPLFPLGVPAALRGLAAAPGIALAGALPKGVIAGLAVGLWGLVVYGAWRSPSVRVLLVGCVLLLSTVACFGAVESRYLYLLETMLVPAVVLAAAALPGRRSAAAVVAVIALCAAGSTVDVVRAWRVAAVDAPGIAAQIQDAMAARPEARPVVVIDLPDRAGDASRTLRPPLWRNGTRAIAEGLIEVDRPEFVARTRPHAPRTGTLRTLRDTHPRALWLEVLPRPGARWPTHSVRPLPPRDAAEQPALSP